MSAPRKPLVLWTLTLPNQDVVNVVVMLSVWAVPSLTSGWFLCGGRVYIGTRLLQVANCSSLSPLSFVCLSMAVRSTYVSPVSMCIFSNLSIPIPLCKQNDILKCSICLRNFIHYLGSEHQAPTPSHFYYQPFQGGASGLVYYYC